MLSKKLGDINRVMGILKSLQTLFRIYTSIFKVVDYTFRKVRFLYEIGLIDKDGVVDKKRKAELKLTMDGRMDLSTHYTTFLRLVIRLKSLLAKMTLFPNRLSQDMVE